VDDQLDNRQLLGKLLIPFGFELAKPRMVRRLSRSGTTGTLIDLDGLRMPVLEGMKRQDELGMKNKNENEELRIENETQRLGHSSFKTVIIAVTAVSFEEERAKVFAAGGDDWSLNRSANKSVRDAAQALGVRFVYEGGKGQRGKEKGILVKMC